MSGEQFSWTLQPSNDAERLAFHWLEQHNMEETRTLEEWKALWSRSVVNARRHLAEIAI